MIYRHEKRLDLYIEVTMSSSKCLTLYVISKVCLKFPKMTVNPAMFSQNENISLSFKAS